MREPAVWAKPCDVQCDVTPRKEARIGTLTQHDSEKARHSAEPCKHGLRASSSPSEPRRRLQFGTKRSEVQILSPRLISSTACVVDALVKLLGEQEIVPKQDVLDRVKRQLDCARVFGVK